MFADPGVIGNWQALTTRLEHSGALERWNRLEPALAEFGDLSELHTALRPGCSPQVADAVLGALVRLAAFDGHDDLDGVLVLVHLLAEGVQAVAARLSDLSEDILELAVGQLTIEIRAFPWRRRQRAFAANLLLDTRAALLREFRPEHRRPGWGGAEVLVDPTDPHAVEVLFGPARSGGDDDELDAVEMLRWATSSGRLRPIEASLLLQVERGRQLGGTRQQQLAQAWGINERTLRRRRDRALASLRSARYGFLAAHA